LNLHHFVQGINGIIPGGISINDFAAVTNTTQEASEKILEELVYNNIGQKREGGFEFTEGDKLKAALYLLEKGASIEDVSYFLNWKDFEGLVAEILVSKGFGIIKNLVLTKPRVEIDVVGIKLGVAVLIDCKHWKKTSISVLEDAVNKQIGRTKHYVSKTQGIIAVPAIVTLYQEKIDFINRVPIIPIQRFSSFVDDLYGNLDEVTIIKSN